MRAQKRAKTKTKTTRYVKRKENHDGKAEA